METFNALSCRIQSSTADNRWLILVVLLYLVPINVSSLAYGENLFSPLKLSSIYQIRLTQSALAAPYLRKPQLILHDQSGGRQLAQEVGESVTKTGQVAEMTIQDKKFFRKNNRWYLESRGRLYEIITDSLTIKFKPGTATGAQQKFLDSYQLTTIRKNRLGIYDVKIFSKNNALEIFSDLQGHPLIDYVELNTLGKYEDD